MKLVIALLVACFLSLAAAFPAEIVKPGLSEPVLTGGEAYPLAWQGVEGKVRFELTTDGGETWKSLLEAEAGSGESVWTAPRITTRSSAIRMVAVPSGEELSRTGEMRILAGRLKFFAPYWGETLKGGSELTARWDCVDAEPFELSISLDGGYSWEPLAKIEEPLLGFARAKAPQAFTYKARLRAALPGSPDMEYDRTGDFSILPTLSASEADSVKKTSIANAAPSPATDYVSFGVYTEQSELKLLGSIVNERGDQLITKKFELGQGVSTIGFDIRELAAGAYYVSFEYEGKIEVRNFIKS
ncbi:MAG: T9SS type A sorting domain-containing protein [Chloroflexota bacterium]